MTRANDSKAEANDAVGPNIWVFHFNDEILSDPKINGSKVEDIDDSSDNDDKLHFWTHAANGTITSIMAYLDVR